MIFVLLGIVILIISFIIALISLIREQRLLSQTQEELPEVNANTQPLPPAQEKKEESVLEQKRPQPEPFPWEKINQAQAVEEEPMDQDQRLAGVIDLQSLLKKNRP